MILEAVDLRRSFGGVRAVDDVSISIPRGEVLGIIGANGSGKTTTLNLMTRVLPVESGRLILDGTEYTDVATHKLAHLGVTRTFQNLRLFRDLTVLDNLRLTTAVGSARTGESRDDIVADVVARAGLGAVLSARPSELPYGTQRVVEIARALAARPALICLDEPFAGMAVDEARRIAHLLQQEREAREVTVVIVDHNMEVLVELVERMVALNQGRLIANGKPREVLESPEVIESYVGTDG